VASERAQSQRELQIAEQLEARGANVQLVGLFDTQYPEQSWWRTALGNFLGPRVFTVNGNQSLTDLLPLTGLKNLHALQLGGIEVSDLASLTGLKNLELLDLHNTNVSDLSPLAGLKNLEWLALYDTHVSDLSPLAGLKNLQTLGLHGTQVRDLSPLAGLKNLTELSLNNTQVSDEQVKLLQQALPNCKIVR
jgi:internalin A